MIGMKLNETRIGELAKEIKLTASPDDTVSSVIGKMIENKIYVLPVLEKKRYTGLVTARKIVSVNAPPKAKIGPLCVLPHPVDPETTLAEACHNMGGNDLSEIPVGTDGNLKGIAGFWDIVDWCLKQDEFREVKVGELQRTGIPLINMHESLGKARTSLRDKETGPLLVKENGMIKMVEIGEYLERVSIIPPEGSTSGERRGEKVKKSEIEASTLMRDIRVQVKDEDSVHKLLAEMKYYNATHAILGGSLISPREILKYLGHFRAREDLTRLAVIRKEIDFDELVWRQMNTDLRNFLEKYVKKHGKESILEFKIDIKQLHKQGERSEYVMSARFLSDRADCHAEKTGWDPIEVFDRLMKALGKQIKY